MRLEGANENGLSYILVIIVVSEYIVGLVQKRQGQYFFVKIRRCNLRSKGSLRL